MCSSALEDQLDLDNPAEAWGFGHESNIVLAAHGIQHGLKREM